MHKKIILLILLLLIVAFGTKFVCNLCIQTYAASIKNQSETTEDKSSNLTSLEIINRINQLEDDYNDYIVKNFDKISKNYPKNTKKQDKLYSEYLKQLQRYSELLNKNLDFFTPSMPVDNNGLSLNSKDNVSYRIQFKNTVYREFVSGEISNPNCPALKLVYAGEGTLITVLNYSYLANNESKLGFAIQDYLKLRAKEQKVLGNNDYVLDGYLSVSMSTLTDWIIMWQKFLEENPRFYLKDVVEQDIHKYTFDFATHERLFDFDDVATKEGKKEYQAFLNKVNPKTESYKFVKKCYDLLEMDNFKNSANSLYHKEVDMYKNKYNLEYRH